MASLSNINGLFDVHSTGAILFSTSHGTSGQILKSNGNAAPTWVDASTVIGGPYLPLSGGTLTGATATASGISFTVGGVLNGTSATFSGSISATSTLNTLNLYNNANNDAFRVFRGSLQTLGLWTATNGTILSLSSDTVAGSITLDSRANQDSYINTGGNVGIGTASPLNRTHIVGPTLTTGTETTYGLAVSDVGDETKTLILGYDLVNDVGIIEAIDQQTAWKNLAFAISGNTKVGIGTTSPEQKLHVEGASITVNRGNDDSSIAFQNSTSNATWRIGRDYSNGEALTFAYSATDYPSLTGNGLIYIKTPGDIGIGTASPDAKLDVNGATYVRNVIYGYAGAGNQYGGLSWNSTDDGFLFLKSANVTKVNINSNGNSYLNGGNVGIGTTAFASTANLQLKLGNMGSGIVGEIFDAVDNADNSRIIICGGGTGTPQFSMRHYSAAYGIDMWLNTSSPWDTYIDNRHPSSGFIFRNNCNNDGAEDELMRITGSGNVGIGTASPSTKLHIAQSSNDRAGGFYTQLNGYSYGLSMFVNSGGYGVIGSNGSYTTDVLTMDLNNGNVGIGVTSPLVKTHIYESGDIVDTGNENSYAVRIAQTNTLKSLNLGYSDTYNAGVISAVHQGVAWKDILINPVGGRNVGIGTTSPNAKLHVAGKTLIGASATRSTDGLTVGYSNSSTFSVNSDATDGNRTISVINEANDITNTYATVSFRISPTTSTSMGDFKFVRTAPDENSLIWTAKHGTNFYDRFTIKSDGNVGIGTTSPSGPFHVKVGTSTPLIVASSSYCNNVGIRTTTPTASLQVKGNVSYSYNNYTNVATTWVNVFNMASYPTGLYQVSIIKKTNASAYITAIIKWDATASASTAGTIVNTITSNQLGVSFNGSTTLQSISALATGTLMSANLQCLVTNEDFCS